MGQSFWNAEAASFLSVLSNKLLLPFLLSLVSLLVQLIHIDPKHIPYCCWFQRAAYESQDEELVRTNSLKHVFTSHMETQHLDAQQKSMDIYGSGVAPRPQGSSQIQPEHIQWTITMSLCHVPSNTIPKKKTSFTMSYHKYTMFDIKKSNSAPISPPSSSTPRALHGWSTMAWMQPGWSLPLLGFFSMGQAGKFPARFTLALVRNMASWEIHELAMKVYSWQDHL